MSNFAHLRSNNGRILVYKDGRRFTINPDHINYASIEAKIKDKDYDGLEDLIDVRNTIERNFGHVTIKEDKVFYKERELHGCLVNKIIETVQKNESPDNLVKFLNNLMENPSKRSVDTLYEFLDRYQFKIDDDGYFLAYKSVRSDYLDWHSGTIANFVGSTIEMERNLISDDPNHACHYGLHVGAIEYASKFNRGSNKLLVVRVNPRDTVCVPFDCSYQKIRVCRYEILSEVTDNV